MKKTILTASMAMALALSAGPASAALYVHQDAPRVKADIAKQDSFVVIHDDSPENYDRQHKKSPVLAKRSTGKEPSDKYFEEAPKVASNDSVKVSPYGQHKVKSPIEYHVAKMEKGFLSNGMRKHLEDMGWDIQWTSGSDRKISVPYTIEYKTPIDYVTQVSGLYGITVDVYPKNKTVHVQD